MPGKFIAKHLVIITYPGLLLEEILGAIASYRLLAIASLYFSSTKSLE